MKTDELISLLATNAGPAVQVAKPRLLTALAGGMAVALAVVVAFIGVRSDIESALWVPMFWVKLGFPLSLVAVAFAASHRLARPGVALGRLPAALLAPVLVMWLLAAIEMAGASDAERVGLLFGSSWKECLALVSLLSIPVFGGTFWAMRGLAPTRPALAGAAAGLLAGATGAATYALHCPEMAAPFLGVWYLFAMVIPAVAGAIGGSFVLRW